jgi:hypothetical protein
MWRTVAVLTLVLTAHATTSENYRKQPCKTPELAQSCFHAHAKLTLGNGTPSVRLWPIGSHHVYGIFSNRYGFKHDTPTLDNESPELPSNVTKHIPNQGGWTMYGDFEVCPLEPHIEGHMQAACIASASHVIAPKD